jgi:hypothetical protein
MRGSIAGYDVRRLTLSHRFKHPQLAGFDHGDHLFALHRGKTVEKILNRLSTLE